MTNTLLILIVILITWKLVADKIEDVPFNERTGTWILAFGIVAVLGIAIYLALGYLGLG